MNAEWPSLQKTKKKTIIFSSRRKILMLGLNKIKLPEI